MGHAHRLSLRVYYEDTDLAGIVYHANYLKFMERGRTEALRDAGLDQSRLKAEAGLVFVVRGMEIGFLAPARFDDMLEIATTVLTLRGASLEMEQVVMRGKTPLALAKVRIAAMDAASGRPRRIEGALRDVFDALAP